MAKFLVIGDIMLDVYVSGIATRLSPEAPVPVFEERKLRYKLGGAAKVADVLKEWGNDVYLLGHIGADPAGEMIRSACADLDIKLGSDDLGAEDRPTTTKTRYTDAHSGQQLLRVDHENTSYLPLTSINRIVNYIKMMETQVDKVVVVDYEKGVLNPSIITEINKLKLPTFIDPKKHNILHYQKNTIVKMNWRELCDFIPEAENGFDLSRKMAVARNNLDCEYLLVTRGVKSTLICYENDDGSAFFTSVQVDNEIEKPNVIGAGDIMIAALAHNYIDKSITELVNMCHIVVAPYLEKE